MCQPSPPASEKITPRSVSDTAAAWAGLIFVRSISVILISVFDCGPCHCRTGTSIEKAAQATRRQTFGRRRNRQRPSKTLGRYLAARQWGPAVGTGSGDRQYGMKCGLCWSWSERMGPLAFMRSAMAPRWPTPRTPVRGDLPSHPQPGRRNHARPMRARIRTAHREDGLSIALPSSTNVATGVSLLGKPQTVETTRQ
jgi:hypothetical protein